MTGEGIIKGSDIYAMQTGFASLLPQLIHGICWCAVNTFILISGYFSIRPKAKSFFNLYLVCAFYAGLLYVIHLYLSGGGLNRWVVYNTLMPFGLWKTSTEWWFIPQYMILYLIAPVINKAIDHMSKHEMQMSLVAMSVVVFYFGWWRHMEWAEDGYNFINFVYLYFIGRYIALYHTKSVPFVANGGGAILWLIFGMFVGCIDWMDSKFEIYSPLVWYNSQYNTPLCIAAAISLFLAFESLPMKHNKVINWFAASALPIYLVHNCKYLRDYFYDSITYLYDMYTGWGALGIMLAISIGIMLVIPIVDKLRILITNPICDGMCKVYEYIKGKIG